MNNTLFTQINLKEQYNENYQYRFKVLSNYIFLPKNIDIPIKKIGKVNTELCMIKAILFIKSNIKSSIFNTINQVSNKKNNNTKEVYINSDTKYFIEDDDCRIEINFICDLYNNYLITGMVLGFIGRCENGIFNCTQIVYPSDALGNSNNIKNEKRLLLFSNILINNNFEYILPILDLFKNKFDDVVLIGTIFDINMHNWDFSRFERFLNTFNGMMYIIPGYGDPTSCFLPQTPLHRMIFNNSKKVILLSNPSQIQINEKHFIFLDHNYILTDLLRYKHKGIPLNALEALINCRHAVPCSPDTLPSIPSSECDPFIIDKVDFVVAGASITSHREFKNKFIITVPDFNKTKTAILFSMKNKTIEEIEVN